MEGLDRLKLGEKGILFLCLSLNWDSGPLLPSYLDMDWNLHHQLSWSPACIADLEFPGSRAVRYKFLLCKLPSLWHFGTAEAKTHT